jgi:DNA-binding transcriptional MerR regulator
METLNKYNNASIYTIRNRADESLIYVGSTIGPIHKRLSKHKSNCKFGKSGSLYSHIIDNDWTDWYIELYEKCPCNDREELCRREGQVIRDIGTINKNVTGSTRKESNSRYYTANREKHKEIMVRWRDANRDKVKESKARWQEANRDKVKQWRDANRDKVKEYKARWRDANPDYMKEYRRRKRSLSV